MPIGDAIPGWGQTPGQAPAAVPQSSIPDRLAETWQLYRTNLRVVLELALPIQGILGLVYAPASVSFVLAFEQQWGQQAVSGNNVESLRRAMAAYLPSDVPSVIGRSLAPAAGLLAGILLTIAFALLLERAGSEGQGARPTFRLIFGRAAVFAVPLAIVALAGSGLNLLESSWITSAAGSLQAADSAGAILAIDGLILVASILVVYGAGRWVLAIPIAAVEHVGLRSALARSTELSTGHRLHVLLSLLVVSFGTGLVFLGAAWGASLIAGALFGPGSALAFGLCLVVTVAALVVTAPLIPILIVSLYRDLTGAAGRQMPDRALAR